MKLGLRVGRRALRPTAPGPRRIARVRDRGSATAELAVSLPALVLMMLAAITAVVAMRMQLQCVDAASQAARATARGESGVAAGQPVAPPGATIEVRVEGGLVRATVRATVRPLGGRWPGFGIDAFAVAALEPGVQP